MGTGDLSRCGSILNHRGAMDVEDEDGERGKGSRCRQGKRPSGPPWLAHRSGWRGRGFFDGWQRERYNRAALRAEGEMIEQLLTLVRRQRLLDKCADLVRVWMLAELESFVHRGLDAGAGAEAL
jgi:hypothetical protein